MENNMKKRHQAGKRIAAWLMVLSLCVTAVPAEQVVYAAGEQNETEITELTQNPEVTESTEAMGDSENAEGNEAGDSGEDQISETTENTGTEENSEMPADTESTEIPETTENTESTQATEDSEMTDDTESTEALIGDNEAADTEKEESEDILKKDGNVTPGSTYAAATSIGLNTTYNATTSRTSVTHWYKFTMSKAGMVQLKFAHANLSSASNSTAWRIDFIADQVGGLVTVTSGMQDTQNQTAKIGLDAGTYYVQITGTGVLTVGSAAYSFSVQYEDTYCETEQNNTIATADNYDRLGQTITGSISSASDTDYYKITSTTKGYLSFQLQHDKVSGRLSTDIYSVAVCDAAGNTLYTMTSKKDEEKSESVNFGLDAGTYYLKVSGIQYMDASGSLTVQGANGETYKLKVSWTNADNWESESNDDINTADTMTSGKAVYGSLYGVSDSDYYGFQTTKDGYIVINLQHSKVTGWQNKAIYAVTVCDTSGNSIYEMTSKAEDEATDSIKLGLSAGKYYIKVAGQNAYYGGNYVIKTTFKACSTWEHESNDTYDTANTAVSGTTYSGDIRTYSDVDYFKTSLSANGYINVKLTHPVVSGQETTNMFVLSVIRKVDKDQYTEVYTTKIRGGDTSISTPNLGLPKGEYYIKIAGTGNTTGTLLSGTSYPVNYDVCIKAKTASDREVESNDSAATANTVKNGKTYYGSTSSSSDKDYYKIKMSKAGYLQIKFGHKNSQSTASCYNVVLYNKDNSEIYKFTNTGTETSYTSCKLGLDAGEYYVCVSQASTLYTGDYTICLTQKAASGWETENNGDWASADNIQVGKAVKGVITGYSSDEDYYRFTLTKAQYINFSLAHEKINDAGRSWYVTLYNADAKRGYQDYDHIYSYAGSTYTESSAVKLSRGTYYLKVQAFAKNAVDKEYTLCVNKIGNKKTSVTSVKSTAYNKLKVSWKVVPAAASYQVYRSTKKDGDYQNIKTIDSVGTSSWTDSSVKTGKTYYYKIKVVVKTQNGNQTSGFSNVKSAKAVPAKTTLKAKASNAKNVKLTWSKVKGANGYEIYRSNSKDGKYSKVKTISKGSTTSYKDGKLKKSTTYYYKIRAYRKVDRKKVYGSYSSVVSVKTKAK
jgi:fibronectin type 3 domain-containing protein